MKGKPYKFDELKRTRYLELLATGSRRGIAARTVGVTPKCVWDYRRQHTKFRKAESMAEMEANEQVEDALFQAAISGNVVACQVWLYNRQPDRWMDKRNLAAQISGPGGEPLNVQVKWSLPRPRDTGEDGKGEED